MGITDKEMEFVVIYQQIESSAPSKTPQELRWSPRFFEPGLFDGLRGKSAEFVGDRNRRLTLVK